MKSRTIDVAGSRNRDSFRKISVSLTAELDEQDDYHQCYDQVSAAVDEGLKEEGRKIKEALIKNQ